MPNDTACSPLTPGSQIDEYRIERQISGGGFSMVYLARDAAGKPVAIKEYMPAKWVSRAAGNPVPRVAADQLTAFACGMRAFLEEARTLAHIKHPNVVQVINFVKANDTAYMVMRYESGQTLHQYVKALHEAGEAIREDVLRKIFVRLLSGLREVHLQKLLHLDIKPANIYLHDDGHPVLLDFGATRLGLGESDAALGNMFTPGYAAPEQQGSGEALGPWIDIYSVGATLYSCLANGEQPRSAGDRLVEDSLPPAEERWRGRYSLQLLELIDWCLKLQVMARPQSVQALQKVLNGELLDLLDPNWFDS